MLFGDSKDDGELAVRDEELIDLVPVLGEDAAAVVLAVGVPTGAEERGHSVFESLGEGAGAREDEVSVVIAVQGIGRFRGSKAALFVSELGLSEEDFAAC